MGLDLHPHESHLSISAADGTITDRRSVTSRERVSAVVGERPPACILLEPSTEREWVARHLATLGHEVIVADPTYAPMYANPWRLPSQRRARRRRVAISAHPSLHAQPYRAETNGKAEGFIRTLLSE